MCPELAPRERERALEPEVALPATPAPTPPQAVQAAPIVEELPPAAPPPSAPDETAVEPPPAQLADPVPGEMCAVPLGTLIYRAGLLPSERIEDALREGMRSGRRLGEILVERGWLEERDLDRLLAGQNAETQPVSPLRLAGKQPPARGELRIRHARKDGRPVVTLRHVDRGSESVVECEVYPVDRLLVEPLNPGPRVFASSQEASVFLDEAVEALQYLGCEVSSGHH